MLLALCQLLASLLALIPSEVRSISADEVLQSELANRLALKVFEDLEELDLVERTIVALNDTVNRLRCPKDWLRIGRSCYTGDIGLHFDQWSARDECIRRADKPGQEGRISVATIGNPLELHAFAGLMLRMNLNRVQIRISERLTRAMLAFDQKLDELFLVNNRHRIFSGRRFCTSISLENTADMRRSPQFASLSMERRADNRTESSCFLLDYMPLFPQSSISGQQQSDVRGWLAGGNSLGGRCVLFYNEHCKCPDGCNHLCRYSTDLCSLNPICGPHGQCIDTLKKGIKCECNFLYGGAFCDKVTREGIQIIACVILVVLVTCANSWILRRCCALLLSGPLWFLRKTSNSKSSSQFQPTKSSSPLWSLLDRRVSNVRLFLRNQRFFGSRKSFRFLAFIRQLCCVIFCGLDQTNKSKRPSNPSVPRRRPLADKAVDGPLAARSKRTFKRTVAVGLCTLLLTTLLLASTSITQLLVFRSDFRDESDLQTKLNRSLFVVKKCQLMTSFVHENLLSFPLALMALVVFSCFLRRDKYCRRCCNGRPGLPIPMEPFKMRNRLTTAIIFGLLACEVLKIFEELLFKTGTRQPLGILLDLSVRIGFVFLIGMRYYPLLGSLQLRKNLVCTGVACVYAWFDMVYVVVKQGFCMGFVPISTLSGLVDEARLRLELGSWYVIYGLIRNAPHFACLAFVTAEFTARFVEALRSRSGAVSLPNCGVDLARKSQLKVYEQDIVGYGTRVSAVSLAPTAAAHERMPSSYASCWEHGRPGGLVVHRTDQENFFALAFSDSAPNHIYVRNLLRRHRSAGNKSSNAGGRGTGRKHSWTRRLLSVVYVWRDDFRYSTIAVCTFVTAFVFLYYLACTLVFYHLSRTEGHGFVLNFYFKHILNIRPRPAGDGQWTQAAEEEAAAQHGRFDVTSNGLTFWREICVAGLMAYGVFAVQMFHSMKQYRANKLMMYKGIFEDIPSARQLEPSKMIAQSVHYSGFLIGYMAWGFIIVFYLALLLMCTLSVLFRQRIEYITTAMAFLFPVFMIYVLKVLLVRSTSKAVFTQGFGSKMALNNRKIHAVFVYFNFFFDCFLGIVACLTRLTKALLLNVLFMARLDYSFVGRPLERLDPGFSIYVAFLHTEVAHTHPVMVAFCDLIWRQIVLRRMGLISKGEGGIRGKGRGLPLIRPSHRERARFRWMLSYTLIRNGGLLSFRKNLTARLRLMVVQRYSSTAVGDSPGQHNFGRGFDGGRFGNLPTAGGRTRFDSVPIPPSIRVYSTTGVGNLLASAGERTEDAPTADANDHLSEGNSSTEDDETAALLRPNDPDTVPLVFETVYPASTLGQGAAAFLQYLDSWRNGGRLSAFEPGSPGANSNLLISGSAAGGQQDESTTVLRMASYSERDALWRQGVRERVCSSSRYRYHYGCLNQLPAVKMLDLAHYRHLSSQQQRQLSNVGSSNDGAGGGVREQHRGIDTTEDMNASAHAAGTVVSDEGWTDTNYATRRPHQIGDQLSTTTADPSYATAHSAASTLVASCDEYGGPRNDVLRPPVPPRSGSATTASQQYSASGTAGSGKSLLDPYSLLARLSSDFGSQNTPTSRQNVPEPEEDELSFVSAISPCGSLAQAFRSGHLYKENESDVRCHTTAANSSNSANSHGSSRSKPVVSGSPRRQQHFTRCSTERKGSLGGGRTDAIESSVPPPIPPPPAGSSRSTPVLRGNRSTTANNNAERDWSHRTPTGCRCISSSPAKVEQDGLFPARSEADLLQSGTTRQPSRRTVDSRSGSAERSPDVPPKSPGKKSLPANHYTSNV